MYSKSAWNGAVEPYIQVFFMNATGQPDPDPVVSLVIFEWKDEHFIGYPDPEHPGQKIGACQQQHVDMGWCNTTDIGEYILAPDTEEKSTNIVETKAVHLNGDQPKKYAIKNTGYYCVLTDRFTASEYTAIVTFRNAYGELPATQIPKLPFYGGITILYALVAVYVS
jgi:hypothetical protein